MFCPNCGNRINENNDVCLICGTLLKKGDNNVEGNSSDKSNTGLNILSFFIPLIGLILYFVFKSETPIRAKKIGKYALLGFVVGIVIYIVLFFILFSSTASTINKSIDNATKSSMLSMSSSIQYDLESQYTLSYLNGTQLKDCYNISEFDINSPYYGSVKVEENDNGFDTKIWITYDDITLVVEYDNRVKISEEFVQNLDVNLNCME